MLTTDVGRLHIAKEKNIFQKTDSITLTNLIPNNYRDKDNYWFGVSLRARLLVYNRNSINKSDLNGYIDLSNDKWKSKILVRSSNNIYNQSLISAMVIKYGEEEVKKFLKGFISNFARKPSGGDRDQIRAVVAGEGTLTEVAAPPVPVAAEPADLSALGTEKVTAVAEAMSADPGAIKDVAPEIVAGMAEVIEPAAMADLPTEMMGSMVEVMSGDQVSDLGAEQKGACLEAAGADLIAPAADGAPAPTEFAEMPAVETAIAATDAAPTAELVAMIDSVGEVFEFMAAGTGEGLAPEMPEMPEVIAPIDTGAAPTTGEAPTTAVGGDAAAANAAADAAAAAETAAAAEAVAEAEAAAVEADSAAANADAALAEAEALQAAAEANPGDAAAQEAALAAADAADAAAAAAEQAAALAEAEAAAAEAATGGAEAADGTGQ